MSILNPYHNFESIVCISLDETTERRKHVDKIAQRLNIPIEYHISSRHPDGGRIGCFMSHLTVIKKMYDAGVKYGLIFEDDFVPTPGYDVNIIRNVTQFMKSNNDWEIIQLGWNTLNMYNLIIMANHVTQNIKKFKGLGTHAYCISRRGMEKVLSLISPEVLISNHIDVWYTRIFSNAYLVAPLQFDQLWCMPSYNDKFSLIDKIRLTFTDLTCFSQKHNLIYMISLLPYFKGHIILTVIIVIVILIYCKT